MIVFSFSTVVGVDTVAWGEPVVRKFVLTANFGIPRKASYLLFAREARFTPFA